MTENQQQNSNEIELPPAIIESFAHFLVPEIRKFYASEEGKQEFQKWEQKHR